MAEILDKAGRAHPGLEPALNRFGSPVTAARAKHGIAHERLGERSDQFLAIDGTPSATIWQNGRGKVALVRTFSRDGGPPCEPFLGPEMRKATALVSGSVQVRRYARAAFVAALGGISTNSRYT